MTALISTARNLFFTRRDGRLEPAVEVLLLLNGSSYSVDSLGLPVRNNTLDSVRFIVTPESLRQMAESLLQYAEEAEKARAELNKD